MSALSSADLRHIFQKLDKNNDGLVSLDELNWLLERVGVHFTLEELEFLVESSSLNLEEFASFYDSLSKRSSEDEVADEAEEQDEESALMKAFKVFDANGDGVISCEEVQCVLLSLGLWDENGGGDCRSMISVYDSNRDGVLDFEEFKNMIYAA